jgi:hypothetical protein
MSTNLVSDYTEKTSVERSFALKNSSGAEKNEGRMLELMKSHYQADQQVKYLYLQAEIEALLGQLQTMQKRKTVS